MSTTLLEDVSTNVTTPPRLLWYLGNRMKIHFDGSDTQGQLAVIEATMRPGSEPPVHIHQNEDEAFIVLEGSIKLIVNGVETVLRPGDSKLAPRGIPHTFQVLTPVARTIGIITPAGFENFFRALGQPAEDDRPFDPGQIPSFERIGEVAARFGTRLV